MLILVFFVWFQYEDQPRAPDPNSVEKVTTPPLPALAPSKIKTFMIYPFDLVMRRSNAFRIDGDLRPIWIVSGRIRNNSDVEVKSVSIRIQITSKTKDEDKVVDATTLTIDTDIPPDSVSSFSRTVQLMPPNTEWNWNYDVINAK